MTKDTIVPYEPLIAFANEKEISQTNWQEVLNKLGSRPAPAGLTDDQAIYEWINTYNRLGFMAPRVLEGKPIAGPKPLLRVQQELRQDFARLADSEQDLAPSLEDKGSWMKSEEEAFHEAYRGALQKGVGNPLEQSLKKANKAPYPPVAKDLSWLIKRINSLKRKGKPRRTAHADGRTPVFVQKVGEMEIPMMLSVHRTRSDISRVLLTDQVSFVPVINDLYVWVYFRLAHLWAGGLIRRIGRCQNPTCGQFFLAKTDREKRIYCSPRCGQNKDASTRVGKTRERRAKWGEEEQRLRQILKDMASIERRKKIHPPRSQRQVLGEAEKTWKNAEVAFTVAYPRKQGPGYDEGKRLLTQAKEYIKQLRKKVQG